MLSLLDGNRFHRKSFLSQTSQLPDGPQFGRSSVPHRDRRRLEQDYARLHGNFVVSSIDITASLACFLHERSL